MIPTDAWSLIPGQNPAESQPWVSAVSEQAGFAEREARAYAWAMHLLHQLSGRDVTTAIMGLDASKRAAVPPEVVDISAGFIPFDPNAPGSHRAERMKFQVSSVSTSAQSYAFGIVVGVQPGQPLTGGSEVNAELSQVVSVEGYPVVVEYREVKYEAPPAPSGAMSACYAKPRASKRFFGPRWSDGLVIARHSLAGVGYMAGASVLMASGGSCVVADVDSASTIDAAILDCTTIPVTATLLALAPAAAPGTRVDVRAALAGFSADVLRVNDHPTYFGNMVAHRLFLDAVGVSGDSGSLVTRTAPHADCSGVYMGTTGGSLPEGLVQSMRQVVQYFDIDLYD